MDDEEVKKIAQFGQLLVNEIHSLIVSKTNSLNISSSYKFQFHFKVLSNCIAANILDICEKNPEVHRSEPYHFFIQCLNKALDNIKLVEKH
jgi:hypothetical protein